MSGVLDAVPAELRKRARRTAQPRWIQPMLATLSERRDLDAGWMYEQKLDGIRGLVFKRGKDVTLFSRNQLDRSASFPNIVDALREQDGDFIVDGEVVAFEGKRSGFQLMQQGGAKMRLEYWIFDVTHAGGYEVTTLPLLARKEVLRSTIAPRGPLKLSMPRKGSAGVLLDKACGAGWEGLIAKRIEAPYTHGRSRDWLKLKCSLEQEFVIGGFTDPKGSRVGFGALLLGVYDGSELRYSGEVGTGFNHELSRTLRARLDAIERPKSSFVDFAKPRKGVHWVAPKLVAQVGFSEWTRDGRLRHPRFLGLRTDKKPRDVVRERPS